MIARRPQVEYRLRANSLWFVPMVCIAAGVAAAAVAPGCLTALRVLRALPNRSAEST
jgi:hypothetical protein